VEHALHRLLKNSNVDALEGAHLQVRHCNLFIFVIPRGFSAEESAVSSQRGDFFSSLFRLAYQGCKKGEALAAEVRALITSAAKAEFRHNAQMHTASTPALKRCSTRIHQLRICSRILATFYGRRALL
jgi:hypothetical protein